MAMTEYDHLSIKIKDAIPVIINSLKVGGRPMLWGSYGVGKTTIARNLSEAMGYDSCIILHPSQDDVLDYKLPYLKSVTIKEGKVESEEQISAFALSERLPRSGKHLLFVDEINTAPLSLQPTLYSLMLEGAVGPYRLPAGCGRIAAGNREHDKCAANPMSAALKDRMFPHLNVIPDSESWCEWAFQHNIRPEVISFVKDQPGVLEQTNPSDPCGGCTPRSLENLSNLLGSMDKATEHIVIQGTIGKGPGTEFAGYLDIFRNKIDIDAIMENPKSYPLPEGKAAASIMFAITTSLSYRLADMPTTRRGKEGDEADRKFNNILDFLSRLNKTYTIICVTDAVKRNPSLNQRKPFLEFALKHADVVLCHD